MRSAPDLLFTAVLVVALVMPATARASTADVSSLLVREHLDDEVSNSLTTQDNYLFVGTDSDIDVFSIDDPTAPARIGRSIDLGGHVNQIIAEGNSLYALAGANVHILDVTTVQSPVEIATLNLQARGMQKQAQLLYTVGNGRLSIFDVADQQQPQLLGQATIPQDATSIAVSGEIAYLAGGTQLTRLDISDPTNPTGLDALPYPANAVVIVDSIAYLSWQVGSVKYPGPKGLTILDISDQQQPMQVGSFTPAQGIGFFHGLIAEPLAFATDEYGIDVLDVSDRVHPREVAYQAIPDCIGSTCYPGLARVGAIHDSLVYVAAGPLGLWILELPAGLAGRPCDPGHITAIDGRMLADESPLTRSSFQSVWGSRAPCEWAAEHDKELRGRLSGPEIVGHLSMSFHIGRYTQSQPSVSGDGQTACCTARHSPVFGCYVRGCTCNQAHL